MTIVRDLEAQGVRFIWGERGPSLTGNLEKLTVDYREALRPHAAELKALTLWRRLQDQAENKFGQPCARLYPFLGSPAPDFWMAPAVRTPIGLAHLVQVLPTSCRVVKAAEVSRWRESLRNEPKRIPFGGPMQTLSLNDVWPPTDPPNYTAPSAPTEGDHRYGTII